MLYILQTALELGLLYAPVALALFLSYRILDIADLTTDGCFVLGAAVSVTLTAAGHPLLAVPAALLAGAFFVVVIFHCITSILYSARVGGYTHGKHRTPDVMFCRM